MPPLLGDVVARARAAADGGVDVAGLGLERLAGGMSHAVYAPTDDRTVVVKVFQPAAGVAAEREWEALVALSGAGIAPEPVHHDGGARAVVVMTRVPGTSLPAGALGSVHASAIGETHRLVHRTAVAPRHTPTHVGVRAAHATLRSESDRPPLDDASELVVQAWGAARRWASQLEVSDVVGTSSGCFSRGDPNLSNYLWSDDGLALVDWEHSGPSDAVLELADMAEHASTRVVGDAFWDELATATGLGPEDRPRLLPARRLMACFWLVLITSREQAGLPTTVTADEQALRTLAVVGG